MNRRKFSPEFKEEAAKMVVETSQPIAHVARELDLNETTLGNWVKEYRERHAGDEPALQVSDRARLRELERENRELTRLICTWRVAPGETRTWCHNDCSRVGSIWQIPADSLR